MDFYVTAKSAYICLNLFILVLMNCAFLFLKESCFTHSHLTDELILAVITVFVMAHTREDIQGAQMNYSAFHTPAECRHLGESPGDRTPTPRPGWGRWAQPEAPGAVAHRWHAARPWHCSCPAPFLFLNTSWQHEDSEVVSGNTGFQCDNAEAGNFLPTHYVSTHPYTMPRLSTMQSNHILSHTGDYSKRRDTCTIPLQGTKLPYLYFPFVFLPST